MTTDTKSASEVITEEVTSWPGVEAGPGRRGEFAFKVGRREIGHLHGDHAAHFSFPKDVWAGLIEEGRIVPHPVFPDRAGPAARRIVDADDVRDVIALMRLNYDRRASTQPAGLETPIAGLRATRPASLPFAPSLHIRAFVLERAEGNLLVYSAPGLQDVAPAGVARHYLNHHHEAAFGAQGSVAPLFVHEADAERTRRAMTVRGTFSRRHTLDDDLEVIPIPGHTPGSTAYLWDSGERRYLFTGDSVYLVDGEWRGALLESSDKEAYLDSLDLLRGLEFDVLVPWAASKGQPFVAQTDNEDAARRIGEIIERIREGGDG